MFKTLGKILKKFIMAVFLLYGYNFVAAPLGFIIPINFITITLVALLGIPILLSLIFVMIFVF